MSILVVQGDPFSAKALKNMLLDLEWKRAMTASSVAEGIEIHKRLRNRIRGVFLDTNLAGWDFYLDSIPHIDPFGLTFMIIVTSGPPRAIWTTAQAHAKLNTPFFFRHLRRKLFEATRNLYLSRNQLLVIDSDELFLQKISKWVLQMGSTHWGSCIPIRSRADLDLFRVGGWQKVGAILVNPSAHNRYMPQFIPWLKRSPMGRHVPVVLLSKQQQEIRHLRLFGDLVFEKSNSADDWSACLDDLSKRVTEQFSQDLLFRKISRVMKGGSRNILFSVSPSDEHYLNPSLTTLLADFQLKLGKEKKAREIFEKSLKLNPFQPRAYFRLMGLYQHFWPEGCPELQEQAKLYCPRLPQIQTLLASSQRSENE